jgi:1-acyl-sn-glycerol-3-phosphate acyltransferase
LATVKASTERQPPPDLLAGTLHGELRATVRKVLLAFAQPLVPFRIVGEELAPPDGPVLLVSNHLSNVDPIFFELAFPRPLFYMGKSELFRNRALSWLLRRFGGFPVERGSADRAALRFALSILSQGLALGIYPEGGRSRTGALVPALPGAGLLALQSKAPVLPAAITGAEFYPVNGEFPPRRPKDAPRGVTVRFGQPFRIPERVDGKRVTPDEATHLMMLRVAELLPEHYRGVYGEKTLPGVKEFA